MGYSHIKDIGYREAEAKYTEVIRKHELAVAAKTKMIEALSNDLVLQQKASSDQLATSINAVLVNVKGKSLTIIKNGECTPSQTFSDSFSKINKRVNESLK